MNAKRKVEQANVLHAEASAKKKQVADWWIEAHKANKEFRAASAELAAEPSPATMLDWQKAHEKLAYYDCDDNVPRGDSHATDAWWQAKDTALTALAEEAGLLTLLGDS